MQKFFDSFVSDLVNSFASVLASGNHVLLCLRGPLGAGKTTLTRELYEHLGGIGSAVSSPTFVHWHEYPAVRSYKVHHLDLYRIERSSDLERLGLETSLEGGGALWLVEWPDLFLDYIGQRPAIMNEFRLGKMIDVVIDGASHRASFSIF